MKYGVNHLMLDLFVMEKQRATMLRISEVHNIGEMIGVPGEIREKFRKTLIE